MWTPAARAELARESLPYATSLTDAEWTVVAPLLAAHATTGRPWRWSMRSVLDATLSVLRTGYAPPAVLSATGIQLSFVFAPMPCCARR